MISTLLSLYETLTTILRVLICIWAPLYTVLHWYITSKADRDNALVNHLYLKLTEKEIYYPVIQIVILALLFGLTYVHPGIVLIGVVAISLYLLFGTREQIEDALDDQIDDDLSGVRIKCDKRKMPVRLEKIKESILKNVEKEYYEEGEIHTNTPVEWKWDIEEKENEIPVKTSFSGNRDGLSREAKKETFSRKENQSAEVERVELQLEEIPVESDSELTVEPTVEEKTPKAKKKKKRDEEIVIHDAGPSMINAITNVKFYRKPLIEEESEYTLFNMDTQKEHGIIQGELLQQLLNYTGKWDESFNNHDIYLVSGIDPYEEHTLSQELVEFIKGVLKKDSEVQLRWVYRTSL